MLAMGSSAYMRPLESQVQQKNAALSVGIRQHEELEQKPETWEEKWEKEISQWGKGASNGVHETHEEFVCKFREKLQEFAMLLTKKYNYKFQSEYFDDYRGNLNKEEFLGREQPKKKVQEEEYFSKQKAREAAELIADAHYENSPLLHFQHVAGSFAVEHGSGLVGNAKTAAGDENSVIKQAINQVGTKEPLAGIEITAVPNANAHKQPWYEYPRQICNPPLLHFEDDVDIFQCAAVVHHRGAKTTAAGSELELYQIAPIEVLSQITTGIDLGHFRTRKKKKSRRRKREKEIKQKMKVGVG